MTYTQQVADSWPYRNEHDPNDDRRVEVMPGMYGIALLDPNSNRIRELTFCELFAILEGLEIPVPEGDKAGASVTTPVEPEVVNYMCDFEGCEADASVFDDGHQRCMNHKFVKKM